LPYALEALPLLRAAAGDPDPAVRAEAMAAYERLSPLRSQAVAAVAATATSASTTGGKSSSPGSHEMTAAASSSSQGNDCRNAGSGSAAELGAALMRFHLEAAVVDPSRPFRALATHPAKVLQALDAEVCLQCEDFR